MGFAIEERELLELTLDRFLGEACSLEKRRERLASDGMFSRENWAALADMGVLALPFDECAGGLGGSLADVMAVSKALGRRLALEPYLHAVVIAGRLVANGGTAVVRNEWLAGLMAGERLVALAHLERGDLSSGKVATTRLTRNAKDWRLSGAKFHVPFARELDAYLVTARDQAGRLRIGLVPADKKGIDVRSYRLVDGQLMGEVTFDDVLVDVGGLLESPDLEQTLDEVLAYARAVTAADSVGCMQELLRLTIEYANARKQFGQPIARFQVIKHRLVDGHVDLEQAQSMLDVAALEACPEWLANVAATKAFVDACSIRLGHDAIQIHGAMGLTDELAVSHYHKRIVANSILHGNFESQFQRFAEISRFADPQAPSSALHFESLLSPGEAAFQHEVRAFLAESLTPELKKAARRLSCTFPEKDVTLDWQRRLNERGWLAPLWPKELGGTGWSASERFLFEYECAVAGAPERIPMGFRYVGPVVAQFGSDWQKSYFMPKLLSGEHYWAQGFSEPAAGSDLVALKTTAVLQGDHYIVNGTKIWTTHAHYANWIFCLVRTAQAEKPQDGISFLLIDLTSPGIRIEPIPLLAVDHEVCQVFFDDVRVPAANLVGEAGRGWQQAKFLLELERGGSTFCGRTRFEFNAAKEIIARQHPELLAEKEFLRELAVLEHRVMALEMLEFRLARAMNESTEPGVGGSITKLLSSELQQDVTELAARVAGFAGLELEAGRPIPDPERIGYPGLDLELVAMPRYLNTLATTIFGGSSEIQHEIIGKHVLGLHS